MYKKSLLPVLFVLFIVVSRILLLFQSATDLFPQSALLGYRGQLLIQSGVDETSRRFPMLFGSVHSLSGPVSTYLVAGSVWLFGLQPWAVRLPFTLISIIALAALWLLIRKLLPRQPMTAWWSVLIMGISPVHAALSLSPSEWFLHFNLALILIATFISVNRRLKTFLTIICLLIFIYFLFNLRHFSLQLTRILADQLNFRDHTSLINSINQMRGEGSFFSPVPLWSRLLYNKLYLVVSLVMNFLAHLKPQFYFTQAGRSSIYAATNFGLFVTAFILPFIFGIKEIVKQNRFTQTLLVIIFLIGLLLSVLSFPSPHPEKLLIALIPLIVISALGIQSLDHRWQTVLLILAFFHFSMFMYDHIVKEPVRTSGTHCAGVGELADYLKPQITNFQQIFVSDAYCPQAGIQLAYHLAKLGYLTKVPVSNGGPQYKTTISEIDQLQVTNQNNWQLDFKKPTLLVFDQNSLPQFFNDFTTPPLVKGIQPPCFKQIGSSQNVYGKKIYDIYQITNPNCVKIGPLTD